MESPWIEWNGGECPVDPETPVAVRFTDGITFDDETAGYWSASRDGEPDNWIWSSSDPALHIIAYRIVQP